MKEKRDKQETAYFGIEKVKKEEAKYILKKVYEALKEKGYNPVSQLTGYILSGDPTYITSHKNARAIVTRVEKDELLEVLVENYFEILEQN
ncbi:MAG: IreB family regulatory phosphoprotein [Clostridiales bacterium]|nr:IreB family regulatory phosphoprotein [Clostridiales bacterium]